MRILVVSGWRHWVDTGFVIMHLEGTLGAFDHYRVGDATGVDLLTRHWLRRHGLPWTFYPANWDQYGKGAGSVRNQNMLDGTLDNNIPATNLLAFPEPQAFRAISGTWDCIRRAWAMNIPHITPFYTEQEKQNRDH